ncbi:hypothetical protein [Aquimarina sp. AU58]|uniref:hypothetical protein n=1 Tax=Aquimarina sp. AU58 TaxID=1874112 RepID=UPI0013583FCD|nr:hypothetical protein [Aquimarina sp. AU58]
MLSLTITLLQDELIQDKEPRYKNKQSYPIVVDSTEYDELYDEEFEEDDDLYNEDYNE